MLIGSTLAGGLWQWLGPHIAFAFGAAYSAVALAALILGRRFLRHHADG
jgi:hypothetical protein